MMKFSSRLNWNLTPNPLTQLLESKRAQGAPILDLTESNPTRARFTYDDAAILSAMAQPQAMKYEPSPRGLLTRAKQLPITIYKRINELMPTLFFNRQHQKPILSYSNFWAMRAMRFCAAAEHPLFEFWRG